MNEKLPQSVRRSMAKPRAQGPHPSADLLTAFAEQSLSAAEKDAVSEHVSRCSECREVLFLAGSAIEEPTTEIPIVPVRRFRPWAWAIPFAAVILIGATVLLQEQRHPHEAAKMGSGPREQVGGYVGPQTPANTSPSQPATVARNDKVEVQKEAKPDEKKSAQAKEKSADKNQPLAKDSRDAVASISPVVGGNVAPAAPVVAIPPQGGAQTVNVQSEQVQVATEQAQVRAADTQTSPAPSMRSSNVEAAKAAAPVANYSALPTWRVTSEGQLQHFADSTWTRTLPAYSTFRVVTVIANDVWVGGAKAVLFRSSDQGATWQNVFLPGIAPDDAITSIHFTGPSQGEIRTTTGARFISVDSGHSWTKR